MCLLWGRENSNSSRSSSGGSGGGGGGGSSSSKGLICGDTHTKSYRKLLQIV